MTILQQPENYNFAGNIPEFIISDIEPVPFRLMKDEEVLLDELYTPDPDAKVTIDLVGFFEKYLSINIPDSSESDYSQVQGFGEFTAEIGDGSSPTEIPFTVVKGGVDYLENDEEFFKKYFLTWQPRTKRIKSTDVEWLSYFSVNPTEIRCTVTDSEGTEEEALIKSIAVTNLVCLNVSLSVITELVSITPVKYDVWVKEGEDVISISQSYILTSEESNYEDVFVFENSMGGIDSVRYTGILTSEENHEFARAIYDKDEIEYDVSPKTLYTKNTGDFKSAREIYWLRDFFKSRKKFHFLYGSFRKIISLPTSLIQNGKVLSNYDFKFKYMRDSYYQPLYQLMPEELFDFLQDTDDELLLDSDGDLLLDRKL
ncbi:MAG: hypothetical protein JXR07_20000 [Reichenbachiella sp.]